MEKQRIYYPQTTYSQRRILFEVWEATGDVNGACEAAHVSRRTFYYWKARFKEQGYEGLKEVRKPGPAKGIRVSTEIQEKVEEMKKAHPEWGKQRIADELTKENSWVPLVSVNTVRRILQEKGLWEQVTEEAEKKSSNQPAARQRNQSRVSM
ncbi:MAG: helix-turn-helix domain-containing protein [Chloroflexi bacterium]|nr:helix-turn-helix domain-containing protein [Chloroflexota bacterium]